MNYIKHINMFFEMATGEGLSLKALGLYMVLLDKRNKLKFIETFKMTNSIIMSITNCSLHELRTARKELEEKKYIIYEKGKIGQAGTYKIINLEKEKIKKDKKSSEKSSIDFSLVENKMQKSSEQNGVNISLVDKKSSEKNNHFLYTLYKQTNNNKQTKKDIYIYNTREKKLNNELDNINNNNSLTKEANKNKEFGLSKEKNTEIKLEIGKEKKDKIK